MTSFPLQCKIIDYKMSFYTKARNKLYIYSGGSDLDSEMSFPQRPFSLKEFYEYDNVFWVTYIVEIRQVDQTLIGSEL